jgi:hypothetical protein
MSSHVPIRSRESELVSVGLSSTTIEPTTIVRYSKSPIFGIRESAQTIIFSDSRRARAAFTRLRTPWPTNIGPSLPSGALWSARGRIGRRVSAVGRPIRLPIPATPQCTNSVDHAISLGASGLRTQPVDLARAASRFLRSVSAHCLRIKSAAMVLDTLLATCRPGSSRAASRREAPMNTPALSLPQRKGFLLIVLPIYSGAYETLLRTPRNGIVAQMRTRLIAFHGPQQRRDQIDGQREHNCRALFAGDVGERLQIT